MYYWPADRAPQDSDEAWAERAAAAYTAAVERGDDVPLLR